MFHTVLPATIHDTNSTPGMIRRLLTEYAGARWRAYSFALLLMVAAAGFTAFSTHLVGQVINHAYVGRQFTPIVQMSFVVMGIFVLRGFAIYGHSVILARIGNS